MAGKKTAMSRRPAKKPKDNPKKAKTAVAIAPRPRKRPAAKTGKATPKIRKA